MMQVLQKYSTDKQLSVVLDTSGQPNNVLYASNTIDITRDIIALYDAAAPLAPVAPPSAAGPKPAGAAPAPVRPRPAPVTPAPKQP
jgi:hypothetical protein